MILTILNRLKFPLLKIVGIQFCRQMERQFWQAIKVQTVVNFLHFVCCQNWRSLAQRDYP
jgi:hypothetical protein